MISENRIGATSGYRELTHRALHDVAVAAGMSFRCRQFALRLSDGPKPVVMAQVDFGLFGGEGEDHMRRLLGIDKEIRRRWGAFTAWMRAELPIEKE